MNEKLQVTAPNDREIVMTRVFDAPKELVWDAWTKPELLKRWLGKFNGWWLDECEVDLRVGGRYRFVWKGPNGESMGMGGEYREIVPNELLVATEVFDEAWYEGEALNTLAFHEQNGRTTLVNTSRFDTNAIRDAVLQSPMATGVAAGYDVLDDVLASLGAHS